LSNIRVTHSGLISLVTGILTVITGFGAMIIVTRLLTPEEFGSWSVILRLIMYTVIIESSISFWVSRELPRKINSSKTAIFSSILFSLGGILLYLIIAHVIGNETEIEIDILLFAIILIPVLFVNQTLLGISLGWKPHLVSYGNLALEISKIPFALLLIYFLDMGILGVILTFFFSHILSIAILSFYSRTKIKNQIKIKFLRKWIKISWIPLFPAISNIFKYLDITIFTIITGSVIGVSYFSVSLIIANIVYHAANFARPGYPKLLSGERGSYVSKTITNMLYFAFPFALLSITFAKPALFILNPEYQVAIIIVLFLTIHKFFVTINHIFGLYQMGAENIDVGEKSTFKEYIKSKLFRLPTIQIIQYGIYLIFLTSMLFLLSSNHTQLELAVNWSLILMVVPIPYSIYLYLGIRNELNVRLEYKSILIYLGSSIGIFSILYIMMERFLSYDLEIFQFIPQVMIFVVIGFAGYFLITYFVDNQTKLLFKAIIDELRKILKKDLDN